MTVRKRLQFATMVFRAALRRRLIQESPFADVSIKASMPDRGQFITHADTARLIEACPNHHWRTTFLKIVQRAGLQPWPRIFHNLRSSRQTELAEQFPSHVVCAWLGNSEDIARRHYLQVTDDHFAEASSGSSIDSGARGGALVAQNQAQHAQAGNGTDSHEMTKAPDIAMAYAIPCETERQPAKARSGWAGIRTQGTLTSTAVFKTAAFDHSATHPIKFFQCFRRILV